MPKEETIQLIKIKNTIGENTDLPISSTRSSLSSKLKSVLLKMSGISNLINSFGTAESTKALTTTVIPGAMKSDGIYLYVTSGLLAPGKIDKIDLDTFTVHSTLDLSAFFSNFRACEIVGRYLYVVTYTSPAKIAKINLDSFTLDSTLTLTQNLGTSIISDGTDLYIGHETTTTVITKVDIDTFTETTTLDTLVGEGSSSLQIDTAYLYVIQISNPAKVTRVQLSSFTVDSTVTLTGTAWGISSAICGNYLYVSAYSSKISKVDLNTFTLISSLTTTTNYALGSALGIDGTYLISAGVPSTASPSITYIDLATFTEYGIYNLPANNNTWSFALDGTFFYFGLVDGTIFRKYIQPTTSVDSRAINIINSNSTKIGIGYDGLDDAKELTSTVRGHLLAGLIHGTGTVIADNKSVADAIGHDGATDLDTGVMGQLQDYVNDDVASIYGRFGAFTGPVDGTAQDDNVKASLDLAHIDLDAILAQKIEVHDVIIYPVSEHAGTTEITDDGTSPAYYADTESGTATLEASPNVHWLEDINFENAGTITVISMYLELHWQHKTSAGTAYSKVQVSGDGGSAWVDCTDSIAETNTTYQPKTRIGVGNFLSSITAGANQLQFRLVSWEAAGNTSSAKIRSDSYIRITYRKS